MSRAVLAVSLLRPQPCTSYKVSSLIAWAIMLPVRSPCARSVYHTQKYFESFEYYTIVSIIPVNIQRPVHAISWDLVERLPRRSMLKKSVYQSSVICGHMYLFAVLQLRLLFLPECSGGWGVGTSWLRVSIRTRRFWRFRRFRVRASSVQNQKNQSIERLYEYLAIFFSFFLLALAVQSNKCRDASSGNSQIAALGAACCAHRLLLARFACHTRHAQGLDL